VIDYLTNLPSTSDNEQLIAAPGEPIVNVTAFTARRQVSGYVGSNVSHLMGGAEPALVFSNGRLVWRVPIILTSPWQGTVGVVGNLDVDARTGQLLVSTDFSEKVTARAKTL
jgi:hypothetical protein